MCYHPRQIIKPFKSQQYRYMHRDFDEVMSKELRPYKFSKLYVPCGKCVQCLKDRSNDLALRVYMAAQKYGSMHLVTLTYRSDTLPLAARLCMVDKDTGEVFHDSNYQHVGESNPYIKQLRDYFARTTPCPRPRYKRVDVTRFGHPVDIDDFDYYAHVTPSLDRRHVRLLFKRFRVDTQRNYGYTPDFKKVCIGEYGPHTCRPHYHLLLIGLTDEEVNRLASMWSKDYGFTDVRRVKCINKDGSNGFIHAARYVSKYLTKGLVECESVTAGDVEKPRLFTSVDLFELSDNMISYYRCEDLFGHYTNSGFTTDRKIIDFKRLAEEVLKRNFVTIDGFRYKLPKSYIKKIWYDKFDQKIKASNVRYMVTSFVQSDLLAEFVDEFRQACPNAGPAEISAAISAHKVALASDIEGKESFNEALYYQSFKSVM